MSTADILAQLPHLNAAERDVIRTCLDEIKSTAPATPEEIKTIAARFAAYRQRPDKSVLWTAAEPEIRKELGL